MELCVRSAQDLDKVVSFGRELLQHHISHVHQDDPIQGIVWVRHSIIHGFRFWRESGPKGQGLVIGQPRILEGPKGELTVCPKLKEDVCRQAHDRAQLLGWGFGLFEIASIKIVLTKGEWHEEIESSLLWTIQGDKRVREVAYGLELPEGSRIYNVFHVCCLKKEHGQQVTTLANLPHLDEEG